MLSKENKEAVLSILNKNKKLSNLDVKTHNFAQFQQSIVQLELKNEINALEELLENPECFEEKFKKRCAWRETDKEQTIPFSEKHDTRTNRMYWEVATTVFKPENMREMFKIVLPGVTHQIEASTDFIYEKDGPSIKEQYRKYAKKKKSNIEKETLAWKKDTLYGLKEVPATLDELEHYVFSNQLILDVNSISNCSLEEHANLRYLLEEHYPTLTKKLYTHNHNMETIHSDINRLQNKGLTPRTAIKQLIKGLAASGQKITKSAWASERANKAIELFFEYFNQLPEEAQDSLMKLKYTEDSTFKNIIEEEISKGRCVETAAGHLESLLKLNDKNDVLDLQQKLTTNESLHLKNKYTETINTQKDNDQLTTFPKLLIEKAIKGLELNNEEDFLDLIISFPPEFYEVLLGNVVPINQKIALVSIATLIKNDVFDPVQTKSIKKALAK